MSATWYNTGRSLRFFGIDGRALFFLVLSVYHIAWWTFGTAVIGTVMLVLMERKGYSIPNALRRLRILIIGRHHPAVVGRRLGRSDR